MEKSNPLFSGNTKRSVVNVKHIFPPTNSHYEGIFEDISFEKSTKPSGDNISDNSTLVEEKVGVVVFHSDASDSDYEVSTGDRVSFQKSVPTKEAAPVRNNNRDKSLQVHECVKTQPLVYNDNQRVVEDDDDSVFQSSATGIMRRDPYNPEKRKAPLPPQNSRQQVPAIEVRKKRTAPAPPSEISATSHHRSARTQSVENGNTLSNNNLPYTNVHDPVAHRTSPWMPNRPASTYSQAMSRKMKQDSKSNKYNTRRSGVSEMSLGSTIRNKLSNLFTRKPDKVRKGIPTQDFIKAPQPTAQIHPHHATTRNLHNFTFVDSKIFNPEESTLAKTVDGENHLHQQQHHSSSSSRHSAIPQQARPAWWNMKTMNAVRSDIHQDVYLVPQREPQPDYN